LSANAQPLEIRKSFDQAGVWRVAQPPLIDDRQPSVDEQFAALFETDAPQPPPPTAAVVPVAAKSLLGLILGIAAALLFLAVIVAIFALRPRVG